MAYLDHSLQDFQFRFVQYPTIQPHVFFQVLLSSALDVIYLSTKIYHVLDQTHDQIFVAT